MNQLVQEPELPKAPAFSIPLAALLLVALLGAIGYCNGWRVMTFSAGLSAIWFFIVLVLLSRPPGIPEFVSEEPGSDEQYVIRRDVIPKLAVRDRVGIALASAGGASLLLWLTLAILGR